MKNLILLGKAILNLLWQISRLLFQILIGIIGAIVLYYILFEISVLFFFCIVFAVQWLTPLKFSFQIQIREKEKEIKIDKRNIENSN